jgi:LuxR family maltose regulon positive regulatory protein
MPEDPRAPLAASVPPKMRRTMVSRSALVEEVIEHDASLVLFIAPAGFGKTSTMLQLRDALEVSGTRAAWWTLDRADNDLQRLLAFLRQVLRIPEDSEHIVPFGLDASGSGPVSIFLDDFELVVGGLLPGIVNDLLDQLPRGSRVVIGSRRQPGIGLAKLRAQGAILEIGVAELQFSERETNELLQYTPGGGELSRSARAMLQEKTAGWPAAVALAATALAHSRHGGADLRDRMSASMQPVAEYLSEVVLDRQPQDIRDFLLCTSVLHYLEPAVCHALLVPELNSFFVLERLHAGNLFVVPVPARQDGVDADPIGHQVARHRQCHADDAGLRRAVGRLADLPILGRDRGGIDDDPALGRFEFVVQR